MSLTPTPVARAVSDYRKLMSCDAHGLRTHTPSNSIQVTFEMGGSDRTVSYDVRPHLAGLLGSMMKAEEITLVARDLPRDDEDTLTLKLGAGAPSTSDRCIIAASPAQRGPARELHDVAPTSMMLDTVPDAFAPASIAIGEDSVSTMRLSSAENPAQAFTAEPAEPSDPRRQRVTAPSVRRRSRARSVALVAIAMVAFSVGATAASPQLRAKASRTAEMARNLRGNGQAHR